MKGLREFIIGFSFSLASVSLGGQLYTADTQTKTVDRNPRIAKIDLFKSDTPSSQNKAPTNLFANIEHYSLIKEDKADATIGQIPQGSSLSTDTPNDDEILSINIEGTIPIEYAPSSQPLQQAEILHYEDADISAMLPTNVSSGEDFTQDSPWVTVKGSKFVKNKQVLHELESKELANSFRDTLDLSLEEHKEGSYRVAERIKSSLLFPIPNEILNDENLTPTFIKKKNSTQKKNNVQKSNTPASKELTLIPQQSTPVAQTNETDSSKGFLDNISAWFSPADTEDEKGRQRIKQAPLYSSQEITRKIPEADNSGNDEFVSFYRALQETSRAHQNNSIIPSELKLSFQPERAEISGQTLRWLKAFSEAAQNDDTYLQVRLDVSASTELQRRRLNLLYTIFMNNGVDFQKIDTVFSLTEPNAFIIRTLKVK